jgi:hypothetical protein
MPSFLSLPAQSISLDHTHTHTYTHAFSPSLSPACLAFFGGQHPEATHSSWAREEAPERKHKDSWVHRTQAGSREHGNRQVLWLYDEVNPRIFLSHLLVGPRPHVRLHHTTPHLECRPGGSGRERENLTILWTRHALMLFFACMFPQLDGSGGYAPQHCQDSEGDDGHCPVRQSYCPQRTLG